MKINWSKFLKKFVIIYSLVLIATMFSGCSASWVSAIQSLMPAIQAAITALFSFIFALEGKTVPASVSAFVQKIEADVTTELANVSSILSTITANASATVLQQIEAVFQSIVANLNSILSGLNVTDTSTISKITNFVGLAIAAVEAVLALIPLAMKANTLNEAEQVHADKAAKNSLNNTHRVLQADYHTAVTTMTGEVDVDLALSNLPQTLP